jgi:hypothetical protein
LSTFWIHRATGTVAVDDAVLAGVDVSIVPSNVQLVWWYGTNGEIKYNDRLGIREALTNLAYYVPVFNNWILAAQTPLPTTSGGQNPAITVPQARTVKVNLVDGLFYNKITTPDISGIADTSANAAANAVASGITSKVNTALGQVNTVIGQINTAIDTINAGVASVSSGSNTAISDLLSSVQAAINSLNSSLSTFATADSSNNTTLDNAITQLNLLVAGLTASAVSHLGAVGYPGMNNVSVMLPSAPSGASHAGTVSSISATTTAQETADDPLQVQRAAHKTALAGINTVVGLAAYDITAGW